MLQDVETPTVSLLTSRLTVTAVALRISAHTCQHFRSYASHVWEYIEYLLQVVCALMKDSIARLMLPWFVVTLEVTQPARKPE
jgi:hypothetical protein